MGCGLANSQVQQHRKDITQLNQYQNVGLVQFKIQELNLMDKKQEFIASTLNYFKITLANQQFTSIVHHNFGHIRRIKPQPSEFQIAINTLTKQRNLVIQLYSKQQLRIQKKLAYTQQNVTNIISIPQKKQLQNNQALTYQNETTLSLKLNDNNGEKIGWLIVYLKFIPQNYNILTLRVNSVTLINKGIFKRKVYIRIQIGQQIYESVSAQQNKKTIPSWSDANHSFIIPQFLQQGTIQVFEKKQQQDFDNLLGVLRLNLKALLSLDGLQVHCQQIMLKDQISGSIKLQSLKSINKNLQQIKLNSPKKIKLQSSKNKQPIVPKPIGSFNTLNDITSKEGTTNYTDNKISSLQGLNKIKDKNREQNKHAKTARSKPILPPLNNNSVNTARQHVKKYSSLEPLQDNRTISQNPQNLFDLTEQQEQKIKWKQRQKQQQNRKQRQRREQEQNQDKLRINIMKTQSILINNKSKKNIKQSINNDDLKDIEQGIDDYNQFEQIKKENKLKIKQIQSDDQSQQNKNRIQKRLTKFTKQKPSQKQSINNQQDQLRFKQIENDLQSKQPKFYNNSVVFIQVQQGYSLFDLSLKQQSNQLKHNIASQLNKQSTINQLKNQQIKESKKTKDNSFQLVVFNNQNNIQKDNQQNKQQKQTPQNINFKKRNTIKDLNKWPQPLNNQQSPIIKKKEIQQQINNQIISDI